MSLYTINRAPMRPRPCLIQFKT